MQLLLCITRLPIMTQYCRDPFIPDVETFGSLRFVSECYVTLCYRSIGCLFFGGQPVIFSSILHRVEFFVWSNGTKISIALIRHSCGSFHHPILRGGSQNAILSHTQGSCAHTPSAGLSIQCHCRISEGEVVGHPNKVSRERLWTLHSHIHRAGLADN